MIRIKKLKNCCGCTGCKSICPKKCIEMKRDNEGFYYPFVDESKCIHCNLCEKVCPIINANKKTDNILQAYAGYNEDEEIRLKSSSGGIFSILAECILNKKGVVYGAAFDNNFLVEHIRVDNINDLYRLRGSKYVQSQKKDIFIKVKEDLNNNILVLFSGTGCEISGLKMFLQKDYDNLFTVDILCHGVPSEIVWEKYLLEYQDKITFVNFRDKTHGWKAYDLKLLFENDKQIIIGHHQDNYLNLFISNICLRLSCYSCKFKKLERDSDISIGDAWDIQNHLPNLDDDKGTSIIITHTKKGDDLLNEIKNCLKLCEYNINKLLPKNADSRKSVTFNIKRRKFFKKMAKRNVTIDELMNISKPGLLTKIKRLIKKLLKFFKIIKY